MLICIVGLPVGTLTLAKLFDSAVLGWMFGLMLIFGMAMAPLAATVYAAYLLFCWTVRRCRPQGAEVPVGPMLALQVERGSVHASDDAPSRHITVPAGCTLREVVARARADGYLPSISGGRATWVVEVPGADGQSARTIAVCSQNWADTAFVADPDQAAAGFFINATAKMRFNYRCQDDPRRVFNELTAQAGAMNLAITDS